MPFFPNTVDSLDVAGYVVARIGAMPHLKLQKLVYYLQAWHLAILDAPLIEDDFQAWAHGPVSRRIWNRFKSPESPVMGTIELTASEQKAAKTRFLSRVTREQVDLVEDVLREYGGKSAYHLECLTHAERPWQEVRAGMDPGAPSAKIITKERIQKYYRSRLKV